jgi:hypothetical protein
VVVNSIAHWIIQTDLCISFSRTNVAPDKICARFSSFLCTLNYLEEV